MVPPPSWTTLESSGLGRSASLSAGPRIQQVNDAAWPLPGWACANVSVAINRVIRMSRLLKLFRQTRYPSAAQRAQPSLRRARVCLESLGTAEPDGVLERSEEHTSELQSRLHLVCRLLLEKKKKNNRNRRPGHRR